MLQFIPAQSSIGIDFPASEASQLVPAKEANRRREGM